MLIYVLPLIALSLSSCMGDVKELYDPNAYDTSTFVGNYYNAWSSKLDASKIEQIKKYNVNNFFTTYQAFRSATPDQSEFTGKNGTYLWNITKDVNYSEKAPNGVGEYFGATKSLSFGEAGRSEFAYGAISKLFDGRVSCSGEKAKSRVQISESGFGSVLPLELSTYQYMAFALRAATDCDNGFGNGMDSAKRYTTIDLNVTFYTKDISTSKYIGHSFVLSNINLTTDNYDVAGICESENGSDTQMISFYFSDVPGLIIDGSSSDDLKRSSAISITYTLHENLLGIPLTTDPNATGNHYAVMLYEVMLPHATWN